MQDSEILEIFLSCPPGLEDILLAEAVALGVPEPSATPGGVLFEGTWRDVWRANLMIRGAGQVTARIASFRAMHLAQLDKRARKLDWGRWLPRGAPFHVTATCRKSRIYHAGAAAQRVSGAIADATGGKADPEADLRIMVRIEDDLCAIGIDSSGAPLHRRGHKLAVAKAPLRETQAALFLRAAGYEGTGPVLDPMCGSGTFLLEAGEIAAGLWPGRSRAFAFQSLANFDPEEWTAMKDEMTATVPDPVFHGADRDQGAVTMSTENAERAGLSAFTRFKCQPVTASEPPHDGPGLVITNPPYGARIGETGDLRALYSALGRTMRERFAGWRFALVTSEPKLAYATGLPLGPLTPPVPHGGLKIRLYGADIV